MLNPLPLLRSRPGEFEGSYLSKTCPTQRYNSMIASHVYVWKFVKESHKKILIKFNKGFVSHSYKHLALQQVMSHANDSSIISRTASIKPVLAACCLCGESLHNCHMGVVIHSNTKGVPFAS